MLSSAYKWHTESMFTDLEVDYQCRRSTQNFRDKQFRDEKLNSHINATDAKLVEAIIILKRH